MPAPAITPIRPAPHGSLNFDAKPQPKISQSEFRNLLCVLHSLDGHELPSLSPVTIAAFHAQPVRTFLRADDTTAAAIWNAMMLRVLA